jgi:hypothetical protein
MPQAIDFSKIYDQVKSDLTDLAKATLKKYVKEAKKDALGILEESKVKLETWTRLLAQGELSTTDFEWLVNSQKDIAQMRALKQAGLAAIRIDQFKSSVFNLIVDTIFDLLKVK